MKEQVLILKVRYDENRDQTPHTWNWTEILGGDHEVELMNHGTAEKVEEGA